MLRCENEELSEEEYKNIHKKALLHNDANLVNRNSNSRNKYIYLPR
jgi:hypothetical protein